jgi:predicted DNA-binding protein (UPF0251 family)
MPKPKKERFVLKPPSVLFYKPQGIPLSQLEQIVLEVDEYEVIRLVDYEGLHHKDAADKMKISRATCARIIESAHKKIATALTNGQAVRIEGGNFVLDRNRYKCKNCNNQWELPMNRITPGRGDPSCPKCNSDKVTNYGKAVGLKDSADGDGPKSKDR